MVFKKGDPRPEGAGRKKGTTNEITEKYKRLIAESNPIEFLIEAFTKGYIDEKGIPLENVPIEKLGQIRTLTYKERCDIAKDLAKKIIPDLKAIDHGEIQGTMTYIVQSSIPFAPNEKPKHDSKGD